MCTYLRNKNFNGMEFKKAKQILNKNRDKKLTDEEIIEIMKIMEVFVKLIVKDLLESRKNKKTRKWSKTYKKSIDCNRPKGFSQKQYCKYK